MLCILIAIVLFISFILFLPIYLTVNYRFDDGKNKFTVCIKILKIKIFEKDLLADTSQKPKKIKKLQQEKYKIAKKEKKKNLKEKLRKLYSKKEDIFKLFDVIKNLLVFKKISFVAKFGLADAAATGILTGAANIVVYNLLGLLYNNFKVYDINVNITPQFNNEQSFIEFDSIVRIQGVHIINTIFNLIKIIK